MGAGTGPIVWVGSANDTWAGWSANYEQVLSLHGPAYGALATQVFTEFSRMWKGDAEGFRVVPAIEMARVREDSEPTEEKLGAVDSALSEVE